MAENSLSLRRIQHIRAYYHRTFAGEYDFFANVGPERLAVVPGNSRLGTLNGDGGGDVWAISAAVGSRPTCWQLLLTTAAMVGAVNALLIGVAVTLLTGVLSAPSALAITLGVATALVAFAAQLVYIRRASIWLPG